MKKIETGHTPSKDMFTFVGNFVECQESNGAGCSVLILFTLEQSRGRINVDS